MSCQSNFDWKAYALGELDASAKREAAGHLATCDACREEYAGIQMTLAALSTLREEEVPRRIAFVSDKVFEPSWFQRTFGSLLNPTFASACVLAAAIVFHATHSGPSDAEIQARIDRTVNQQVSEQVQQQTAGFEQMQKLMLQVYKSNHQLVNY